MHRSAITPRAPPALRYHDSHSSWTTALREGAVAGTLACVLSTLVLAAAGRRQAGSAVARRSCCWAAPGIGEG